MPWWLVALAALLAATTTTLLTEARNNNVVYASINIAVPQKPNTQMLTDIKLYTYKTHTNEHIDPVTAEGFHRIVDTAAASWIQNVLCHSSVALFKERIPSYLLSHIKKGTRHHHIDIAFSIGDYYDLAYSADNVTLSRFRRVSDNGIFIPHNTPLQKIYAYVLRHFGRALGFRHVLHTSKVMKRNLNNARHMAEEFTVEEANEMRHLSSSVRNDGYIIFGAHLQYCDRDNKIKPPDVSVKSGYQILVQDRAKLMHVVVAAMKQLIGTVESAVMASQKHNAPIHVKPECIDYSFSWKGGVRQISVEDAKLLKPYSISNFFGGSLIILTKARPYEYVVLTPSGDFFVVADSIRMMSRFMYAYTERNATGHITATHVALYGDTDTSNFMFTHLLPPKFVLDYLLTKGNTPDDDKNNFMNYYANLTWRDISIWDGGRTPMKLKQSMNPITDKDMAFNLTTCNGRRVLRMFTFGSVSFVMDVEGNIHDNCVAISKRTGSDFAAFVQIAVVENKYDNFVLSCITDINDKDKCLAQSRLVDELGEEDDEYAEYDPETAYGGVNGDDGEDELEDDDDDEEKHKDDGVKRKKQRRMAVRSAASPIHCASLFDEPNLHNVSKDALDDAWKTIERISESVQYAECLAAARGETGMGFGGGGGGGDVEDERSDNSTMFMGASIIMVVLTLLGLVFSARHYKRKHAYHSVA